MPGNKLKMESLIEQFKQHVIKLARNSSFIHHEWFVEYHLNIVEAISLELCSRYPTADVNAVKVLVWLHDYAKILDKEHEHESGQMDKGRQKLLETGFPEDFVKKVMDFLALFEGKLTIDLNDAPIEVKIASSADGVSHLIGPFFSVYFKENANKSLLELLRSNRDKLEIDWNKKIVLLEVKQAFKARYEQVLEQTGSLPISYLH